MAEKKTIATIHCTADLRIDPCNMELGYEFTDEPIEKCIKCKHSTVEYTTRGTKFKNRLLSQAKSWTKQFGNK